MSSKKKDFFISYTKSDESWAEWISSQLEDAGFTVIIQKWDIITGNNFIVEMQKAVIDCERTLMVLSPNYLKSTYAKPEWSAAYTRDPTGELGLLIPVRVEKCEPPGLLNSLVHIDLYTLTSESPRNTPTQENELTNRVRECLIQGIERNRQKPETKPPLPNFDRSVNPIPDSANDVLSLDHYCKDVIKLVSNIDLMRLEHWLGKVPFPIDQIYTPLKANPRELYAGVKRLDALKGDRSLRDLPDDEKFPENLGNLLNKLVEKKGFRCMVVLGKPGSGKTTLLKYIAYYYASQRQEEIDSRLLPKTPFYSRLKDLLPYLDSSNEKKDLCDVIEANETYTHYNNNLKKWLCDGESIILLDGFDEVANIRRRIHVAKAIDHWIKKYPNTHFVVSSRVFGYDSQYAPENISFTVEIDELNKNQQAKFLQRWFGQVHKESIRLNRNPNWKPEMIATQLEKQINSNNNVHLHDLAKNPLLLSIIALIQLAQLEDSKDADTPLPESRALLFKMGVDLFIGTGNWDEAREAYDCPISEDHYRNILIQAAWLLQLQQSGTHEGDVRPEKNLNVDQTFLIEQLSQVLPDMSAQLINNCLKHSHERTLLLVEQSHNNWGFQHKIFQEYLCAQAIVQNMQAKAQILIDHMGEDHWRLVYDLLLEQLQQASLRQKLNNFIHSISLRLENDSNLATRAWYWLLALHDKEQVDYYPEAERENLQKIAWLALGSSKDSTGLGKFHNFAARGLASLSITETTYQQRLQALTNNHLQLIHHLILLPELLSQRSESLVSCLQSYLTGPYSTIIKSAAALSLQRYSMPLSNEWDRYLFAPIIAGKFYRGLQRYKVDSDDSWYSNAIDGNKYYLDAFELARYPVTYAQYAIYINATQQQSPKDWTDNEYPNGMGNHPLVNINWHQTLTYIKWLNEKHPDFHYFLPSEAQWERAARGLANADGEENRRRYPWGNKYLTKNCNIMNTDLEYTVAVGCFPFDASTEGILNMSGNVWEWCSDSYDDDYYSLGKVEKNGKKSKYKILRGGSFRSDDRCAHCSYRGSHPSSSFNINIGFRVARIKSH